MAAVAIDQADFVLGREPLDARVYGLMHASILFIDNATTVGTLVRSFDGCRGELR
jgi:hypothetical protein